MIYAGAKQGTENPSFYLLNEYQKNSGNITWWSLTLGKYGGRMDRVIAFTSKGQIGNTSGQVSTASTGDIHSLRPAITLKKDIMLSSESGNGSKTNPYVID